MKTPYGYLSFRLFIGGYDAPNAELRTYQNKLLYYRADMPYDKDDFIVHAESVSFNRAALYKAVLPCLEWESRYYADIFDGTQWATSIRVHGKTRKSFGSNAYPSNFNLVIDSLEQLIQKPLN
jgi:hypothetical protein